MIFQLSRQQVFFNACRFPFLLFYIRSTIQLFQNKLFKSGLLEVEPESPILAVINNEFEVLKWFSRGYSIP